MEETTETTSSMTWKDVIITCIVILTVGVGAIVLFIGSYFTVVKQHDMKIYNLCIESNTLADYDKDGGKTEAQEKAYDLYRSKQSCFDKVFGE